MKNYLILTIFAFLSNFADAGELLERAWYGRDGLIFDRAVYSWSFSGSKKIATVEVYRIVNESGWMLKLSANKDGSTYTLNYKELNELLTSIHSIFSRERPEQVLNAVAFDLENVEGLMEATLKSLKPDLEVMTGAATEKSAKLHQALAKACEKTIKGTPLLQTIDRMNYVIQKIDTWDHVPISRSANGLPWRQLPNLKNFGLRPPQIIVISLVQK